MTTTGALYEIPPGASSLFPQPGGVLDRERCMKKSPYFPELCTIECGFAAHLTPA